MEVRNGRFCHMKYFGYRKELAVWILPVVLLVSIPVFLLGSAADDDRIIGIADIHGNLDGFTRLLQQTGLVGEELEWTGGRATLVQTGDYTDRGPEVRRVMDLLMSLEERASKGGGEAIILMGNHEMMNLIGHHTDVTAADYASFADSRSEQRRKSAYRAFKDFQKGRAKRLNLQRPSFTPEMETAWMDAHPLGFVERREAFSPNGIYGKWLRKRRVVVKENDTIFLHAGINPLVSHLSIDAINERVWKELDRFDRIKEYLVDQEMALDFFTLNDLLASVREEFGTLKMEIFDKTAAAVEKGKKYSPSRRARTDMEVLESLLEIGQWLTIHPDGILWFRGYARWTDQEGHPQVEALLKEYGARHFFVGHTPQQGGRIHSRFGGRIFLADTGMLSSFYRGGRASALEIQDGVFKAIYLNDAAPILLYPPEMSTPDAIEVREPDVVAP